MIDKSVYYIKTNNFEYSNVVDESIELRMNR